MSDAKQPLIIPIAHYLGETYSAADKTTTYDLRGGWKVVHLTEEERIVWGLAHGTASAVADGRPWTKAALLDVARAVLPDADRIVDDLLRQDILAEATPGMASAIDFAG